MSELVTGKVATRAAKVLVDDFKVVRCTCWSAYAGARKKYPWYSFDLGEGAARCVCLQNGVEADSELGKAIMALVGEIL